MTNRLSWDKQVCRKNKREVLINTGKQNKHKVTRKQNKQKEIEQANSYRVDGELYDALKEKAIENYDKAIISLQKCLLKVPLNPEIHYQLGVNYLAQKKYVEAENAFQKAVDLEPKQRWYWNGLYDVHYQTRNFYKSILPKIIFTKYI